MNVTTPIRAVPIGTVTIQGRKFDVATHPEFVKFFESLTIRVGGPTGPGTPDLTVAQFEDAGIEETKALLYQAQDAAAQDVTHLREAVQALERRVWSLEQGSAV